MKRVISLLVVVAVPGIAIAEAGTAQGGNVKVKGCVEFAAVEKGSARGHGELTIVRRQAELSLTPIRGLRPKSVHILWLKRPHRSGHWVGGGFKSDGRGSFKGDSVILGPKAVGRRHITRARSVLVTRNSERELKRISKRYRPSGWRRSGRPIGELVAHGKVTPPKSHGFWYCARPA